MPSLTTSGIGVESYLIHLTELHSHAIQNITLKASCTQPTSSYIALQSPQIFMRVCFNTLLTHPHTWSNLVAVGNALLASTTGSNLTPMVTMVMCHHHGSMHVVGPSCRRHRLQSPITPAAVRTRHWRWPWERAGHLSEVTTGGHTDPAPASSTPTPASARRGATRPHGGGAAAATPSGSGENKS